MQESKQTFTGNIYIFHAFDIGDDINLTQIKKDKNLIIQPLNLPKYFKNYHTPVSIELPRPNKTSNCINCKIHGFGSISLTYKIPFNDTLENIKKELTAIDNSYQEISIDNAKIVFKKIKKHIDQPEFFQTRSSHLVVQLDQKETITAEKLKQEYGNSIASMVRFETETLSIAQKNEILDDAIGYLKGDLVLIDPEASFIYDSEYAEILDLFEFANIQHLELRFFDKLLYKQLDLIYEEKTKKLPLTAYLPFIRTPWSGPIADLERLRVDISVITERLESSIKLSGEPYFSELYEELVEKLDLKMWRASINKKLNIISEIRSVYQHKIDAIREDLLSVLVIILIFIELVVGILHK